jgi:phosphoribosyl 1,2-cyclic phosphodiesterase
MPKKTTQELQKIIDDAPEGATHIDTNRPVFYYKIDSFVTEYFTGEVWKDACNVIPAVEDIKSLDDIREILELRKEVERLEKNFNEALQMLHDTNKELHLTINEVNFYKNNEVTPQDIDPPDLWDMETVFNNDMYLLGKSFDKARKEQSSE